MIDAENRDGVAYPFFLYYFSKYFQILVHLLVNAFFMNLLLTFSANQEIKICLSC